MSKVQWNRQTLGLVIGGGLGILVVVAVLLVTLGAGEDESATPGTAPSPATTSPMMKEVPSSVAVPDGDYDAFCAQLGEESQGLTTTIDVEQFRTLYREVDFDAVIAVAPSGLQPSLEIIRDDRDQVLTALEQIDSLAELQPADVPEGWIPAMATVITASNAKCGDDG